MQTRCDIESTIKTERFLCEGIRYKYELRSFEGKNVASFGITLYEIFVETYNSGKRSYYRTGGLFSDKEKALRFFDLLIRNLVTPHNLPYLIEDSFSF